MALSWNLLEKVFTVETIMTPRSEFITWDKIVSLDLVMSEARRRKIDTLPIVEKDGTITSFLYEGESTPHFLNPSWLVSRDTSIPQLLKAFVEKKRPCFFVLHQQDVIGIVTPADFNNPPARTYFYSVLVELEMYYARATREYFTGDKQQQIKDILDLNQPSRYYPIELETRIKNTQKPGIEADIVSVLTLPELVVVISTRRELYEKLKFESSADLKKQTDGLVQLRNDVAHPVQLILNDKQGIETLYKRIKRLQYLINRVSKVSRDLTDITSGIESHPEIMGGDACIAGTRIPVWLLVNLRSLGASDDEILLDYPNLFPYDLTNAWIYANTHRDEIHAAIHAHETA